jgi:hypothetical protein
MQGFVIKEARPKSRHIVTIKILPYLIIDGLVKM